MNDEEEEEEDGLDLMDLDLFEEQSVSGASGGGKGSKWVKKEVSFFFVWSKMLECLVC